MAKNTDGLKKGLKFGDGQKGNPNGRPRKSVKSFVANMKAQGIEVACRDDISEIAKLLLSVDDPKIIQQIVGKESNEPYIAKILAFLMANSGKDLKGFQYLMELAFGKNQAEAITNNITIMPQPLFAQPKPVKENDADTANDIKP